MAQVELRFFDPTISSTEKQSIGNTIQGLVFSTHYPDDVRSRRKVHGLQLRPGDITLAVPVLDTDLSSSDAQFELEISEGSDNWPKNKAGRHLVGRAAEAALTDRAQRISSALRGLHPLYAHNVFEVNGYGTGWVQYKPSATL